MSSLETGNPVYAGRSKSQPPSKTWWGSDEYENMRGAIVKKNGHYRVHRSGIKDFKKRFIFDIYTTLLDMSWFWAMLVLFLGTCLSYLVFACFWWMIGHFNGDFDNQGNDNHTFCLYGFDTFAGAIMYSIETQTTIGYGYAYPNAECPPTIPLTIIQVTLGFFMETVLLGFMYVKLARPKYRANTLMFSQNAVISRENGQMVLQVRIGDIRKTTLVSASILGMVVRRHTTPEGTHYPLYQFECEFTSQGMDDQVFLLWPIVVTHVIDKDSPLYDMKPSELSSDKFELIMFLTGTVESTGEECQARTSYLPNEILWGHRFDSIEEFDVHKSRWHVDFSAFDNTTYCQNIRHSAKDLDESVDKEIRHNGEAEALTYTKSPAAVTSESSTTPL